MRVASGSLRAALAVSITLCGVAVFGLARASAGTLDTWNFSSYNDGSLSKTATAASNGITITAAGFTNDETIGKSSDKKTTLYYKTAGGDETGIGLSG